ncbi:MAG: serine hydrolase domain-containing protein [Vicinamibacteria bacterium]
MRGPATWVAAAFLAFPGPVVGQDATRALDSIYDAVDEGAATPAVAIAVLHHGKIVYHRAAGFANLESGVRATLDTRFDWASVSKQFTGFAVARLVEAGRLAPDDPARRYVPELDLSGATITLEQLLHHTSGLEDSDGLLALAGWREGDVVHDEDVVRILARQQHLRWVPGEQEGYGNGGYALLAEIVARVTRGSFAAYADSAIFRPLGMSSSGFPGTRGTLIPKAAQPYVRDPQAGYVRSRVDGYVGPGGLYATVDDMMRWAGELLQPRLDAAAVKRIRTPGRLASGEKVPYGWGIGEGTYRGARRLLHGGSGVATETFFEVFPDLDFAVAAASAAPSIVDPAHVARVAADLFLADRLDPPEMPADGPRMTLLTDSMISTPPEEARGLRVPAERLSSICGAYRFEDGSVRVFRPRDGRLEYAHEGAPPFIPLFPLPDGRFVMMPLRVSYTFETDERGGGRRVVVETLSRDGEPRREVGEAAEVPRFDAATAAPYVGWYYSDELDAAYRVALGERGLELRHARHGATPLIPLGMGDAFGVDGQAVVGVTFSRGKDGTATGLELKARSWDARSYFRRVGGP